jgi:hypothetical protein
LQAIALIVIDAVIGTAPVALAHVGALPSAVQWITAAVVKELSVAVCDVT